MSNGLLYKNRCSACASSPAARTILGKFGHWRTRVLLSFSERDHSGKKSLEKISRRLPTLPVLTSVYRLYGCLRRLWEDYFGGGGAEFVFAEVKRGFLFYTIQIVEPVCNV
ncbi:hypothetical protein HI914_02007 [Erysiphe necator]|nr:hypothetical protein HI914_02007 [Erysiphe necator]